MWAALPLDAFAGGTVRLRLALRSDGAWTAVGAYVDDLAIDAEADDPDGDGLIGVLDELYAYGTDPTLLAPTVTASTTASRSTRAPTRSTPPTT